MNDRSIKKFTKHIKGTLDWSHSSNQNIHVSFHASDFYKLFPAKSGFSTFITNKYKCVKKLPGKNNIIHLIQSEITRLSLPVILLKKPKSKKWLLRRNVIFFLPSHYNLTQDINLNGVEGRISMTTIPINYPNPIDFKNPRVTPYKIITGWTANNSPLSNHDKYMLLHEVLGHGVLGLKHFWNSGAPSDRPPYTTKLTCEDTVMASMEFCPANIREQQQQFGPKKIDRFDRSLSPDDLKRIEAVDASVPTHMGIIDGHIALEFKKARQHPRSTQATSSTNSIKTGIPHGELYTTAKTLGGVTNMGKIHPCNVENVPPPYQSTMHEGDTTGLLFLVIIMTLLKQFTTYYTSTHSHTSKLFPNNNNKSDRTIKIAKVAQLSTKTKPQ